ncbi:MAG TPA: hypothetical protein VNQ14_06095 [Woeseiaceae bacterium]|nr:hypothetical protein [Woeseiaceae bacterium]
MAHGNVTPLLGHRIVKFTIALGIGLALALYAFHRATDLEPAMQRAREEGVVLAARDILRTYIEAGPGFEIVDPVSPKRAVGKSYVYPSASGWEVSGHYRRDARDRWHPFLMTLDAEANLASLSLKDASGTLAAKAKLDPKLSVQP